MTDNSSRLPDRTTMLAFVAIVFIGGLNFVAVRFSNRELPPFFGAATRFAAASILLFAVVVARRIPLPRSKALVGTLIYGVLSFAAAYALAYWALIQLSAGIAGVVMASVPLLTLFFAAIHGVETLRLRGLIGALLAIAGIVVLLSAPSGARVSVASLIAMVGAAACAAESGVVLKRLPPSHPIATNAVAMATGTFLLFVLSAATRETWNLPRSANTWAAVAYLVLLGSVAMFGLYLFALKRWTASGVSYQFVLFPIVTTIAAAALANEPITTTVAAGGAIVLSGVYVGALSEHPAPAPPPEETERVLTGQEEAPA